MTDFIKNSEQESNQSRRSVTDDDRSLGSRSRHVSNRGYRGSRGHGRGRGRGRGGSRSSRHNFDNYGYDAERQRQLTNNSRHHERRKYYINPKSRGTTKKMSNRNEKRITNRTNSYREMESKLEATTKKLEKCDKERRFYKGTLELINNPSKNFSEKKSPKKNTENKQSSTDEPQKNHQSEPHSPKEQPLDNNNGHPNTKVNNSEHVAVGPPAMPPNLQSQNFHSFYQPVNYANMNVTPANLHQTSLRPMFLNNDGIGHPNQYPFLTGNIQSPQPVFANTNFGRMQAEYAIRNSREHADFYQRMLEFEIQKLNSQRFGF